MNHVSVLAPIERAGLDPERLEALFTHLGPQEAENALCRAVEELAYRLGYLDRLHQQCRWPEMRSQTCELGEIARFIGMQATARISCDVVQCLDDGDRVALAATLARLGRMGERSLYAIWDMEDQSI
ncbi:hypothetical protein AYJ57_08785 [Salipiger sp. CCB-MM3]|uniref:hypothetical protein n=1 Tax=Salipiger sp. CCB-MM3 TaxID=1792508 RepID=UPI00080ABCE3|nr:hypothetical protein [Salipiger sp. CCB-MM3]ANT60446.1 hypothetical protein AYJ57_08785 [Salipiger sp. CCB-MM3]